jgi:hypothetical protein
MKSLSIPGFDGLPIFQKFSFAGIKNFWGLRGSGAPHTAVYHLAVCNAAAPIEPYVY